MDAVSATAADGVLALCERLRSEKLLVSNELENLQNLNQSTEADLATLCEHIWICRQEQLVLKRLLKSNPDVHPENCCRIISAINASKFVPGHRVVGHHCSAISEVFNLMIQSPKSVAEFLNAVDQTVGRDQYMFEDLCRCIFNVVYGSCVFPADEKNMLHLLSELITLQLINQPDARRTLRKGTSALSLLYGIFSEQLLSAKIFLTAALHEPIMFLLSQDEIFLDIDPTNSPIRIRAEERRRRFGSDENSPQYHERMAAYRRMVVEKLVLISCRFVKSIQQAASCFPSSLTWLVRQVKNALAERMRIEEAELVCTELIFTNFICPALINPEPHGIISDTPLSNVARFNLIQIGQILQILALKPFEEPPAFMQPLMARIPDVPITTMIRNILGTDVPSLEVMFPPMVNSGGRELYSRCACLGTLSELQILVDFLRRPAIDGISDDLVKKTLRSLVRKLPDEYNPSNASAAEGSQHSKVFLPRSSSGRLRTFVDKVQTVAHKSHQRLLNNSPGGSVLETDRADMAANNIPNIPIEIPEVLVFTVGESGTMLGLESEEKIMSTVKPQQQRKRTTSDCLAEKKTRFKPTESVVSDHTATTDNASDEEDAEGAESVSSSINDNMADEDEVDDDAEEDVSTLPDNFSDVVPISANVSGRGSPSLSVDRGSGRGTPFSGGGGDPNQNVSVSSTVAEASSAVRGDSHRNLPKLPVTVRKQNPEGLEEKFGKFGLPPQDPSCYRDETYSLVSDSWSTDVVASDNEGVNDQQQLAPPTIPVIPPRQNNQSPPLPAPLAPPSNVPILHTSNSAPRVGEVASVAPSSSLSDRDRIADDILNKYRVIATNSASNLPNGIVRHDSLPGTSKIDADPPTPYYDPSNLSQCRAFLDAKRKLRLVLSSAVNIVMNSPTTPSSNVLITGADAENISQLNLENDQSNNLNELLKILLAESINCQDKTLSAQIREVQRCLSIFDQRGVRKLLRTLKDEHRRRTSYLMYLQQSKLSLLQLSSYLGKLSRTITREKTLTGECLIEMLSRFSLERKEKLLRKFISVFEQSRAQDEKAYHVDRTLSEVYAQIAAEPMWQSLPDSSLEYAQKSMERSLMAAIYGSAMYPNAEADVHRDQVLHKSLKNLSASVTPDHSELRIPKRYHGECPWPSAQAEIAILNAYKSPRDKMGCVIRCCETIENLIVLGSERSTASADDITPILVYVLLQANPPALLSNIQYMSCFYAHRMKGKEAYWWTQFRGAVEFLKHLCNRHLTPSI